MSSPETVHRVMLCVQCHTQMQASGEYAVCFEAECRRFGLLSVVWSTKKPEASERGKK